MDEDKVENKIKILTDLIGKYDNDYYIKNNPVVSDSEYDELRKELKQADTEYLIQIHSIGQNAAGAIADFFKDDLNLQVIKKILDAGIINKNKE